MADSKELKPVSYRIDDETKEKFKQITAEIGGNQQETMNVLINAYYLQSKQNGLEEFRGSIDQFQAYVTSIVTMYTNSLQANHDMKTSVMQEFEALLQSKDNTIQDLQSQLTAAKRQQEEAAAKSETYAGENTRLNEYIESLKKEFNSKLDDMQSMLADKESLNKALTDSCNELKSKVDVMSAEHEEVVALRAKLVKISNEKDTLDKNITEAEKKLDKANKAYEKSIAYQKQHEIDSVERVKAALQIEKDKAVLEIESNYREQIQTLKEQKQSEIDKYQQKYLELLEQMKTVNPTQS